MGNTGDEHPLVAGIAFSGRGRPDSALGPGSEFDLIRSFLLGARREHDAVEVGPGDDAAVVRSERIVLSSDLTVEGTHFLRHWLTPFDIGYRAATASLSDLAAMA